ncbi:hypothetical protein CR513_52796, partial [Mucuna pruriens]
MKDSKIVYVVAKGDKYVKRVMLYWKRRRDYMLTYHKFDSLEIIGYYDSKFSRCLDSKLSTSGYIYMLARGTISCKFAEQTLVASLTTTTKFVACYKATNHEL